MTTRLHPLSHFSASPQAGWLAPLLLFIALTAMTEFFWREHRLRTLSESRHETLRIAEAIHEVIESEINVAVYLNKTVESYLIWSKGNFQRSDLEPVLADLFSGSPYFRNIAIAPNNRIAYAYPAAGNEMILGMSYPDLPGQWPAIEHVIASGRPKLVGPLALIQGGEALILRTPLTVNNQYWGMVSTVIDTGQLFELISRLAQHPLSDLALRGSDGRGASGDVFLGKAELFAADHVAVDVKIPGGNWQLAIAVPNHAHEHGDTPLRILGWLASLALALMLSWLLMLFRHAHRQVARQKSMLAALHHADRELHRYSEQLESEVLQRTAELQQSNDDLRQAKEAAEAANLAKSNFIANVSHEIRTPLHAVIGLTHVLQRKSPRPDQQECLGNILSSAQHLLRLLNDVLDLSRVEADKLSIVRETFATAELTKQLHAIFDAPAEQKKLDFAVDLAELPEMLIGDQPRLQQLLINLVGNAIKFTEWGSIRVHGSQVGASDSELTARFEISDTGIGLSQEQIGRVFNAFEQADNSTTRKFAGTGLGLTISRHLAMLMGGDCGVESMPEEGSTFWFTVRLGKPAPASES